MDGQKNVITYEFQGETLPLEKAFAKLKKLYLRYIRETKKATEEGKLSPDELFASKQIKNYGKRLKALADKTKLGLALTKEEQEEAQRIFKKMLTRTREFKDSRDKILREKTKRDRKVEEKKQETRDFSSTFSQFKAQAQVDQLQTLMYSLRNAIPARVQQDINSYIEAWNKARVEFDGSTESVKRLATATKELDKKARDYIPTLKQMIQNQKRATNNMEQLCSRIIMTVSSMEWWIRKIKEGTVLLGDYVESINFLDVSLKNIKWPDYINNVNKANNATQKFKDSLEEARWSLGTNATDVNQSAATYLAFANAMNFTGQTALDFAQNMSQLSIDMASLYNKDTLVMLTALRSGLAGNTRAMMQYGISVHDATLNEWLLEKGINKKMNALSETSQALVRYVYLMEKTMAAQGDMARTLKSPANQLRVLKTQIQLLTQNLGALFKVVIYPAIRLLNEILIPLNAFISSLTALANEDYTSSIGTMSDEVDDLTDSLDDASDAAVGLTSLDEINVNNPKAGTTNTGIDADVQALVDGVKVYDNFMSKTSKLTTLMKSLGDVLAPIWAMLADTKVLDGISWAINAIGVALKPIQVILDTIKKGYANMPKWLQVILDIFKNIGGVMGGLVGTILAVAAALAVLKTLMNAEIFKTFIFTLKSMILAFINLGKSILVAIANQIKYIASSIAVRWEVMKNTTAHWNLATALWAVVKGVFAAIASFVKYIAHLVVVGVKAIATAFKNLILSKSLWGVAIASIAAAGIAALVVAGIVGTAVAIGAATQKSNEVTESSLNTTKLATGGVATGPTFAMIGEGKYNEAVVPLGNSPQFKSMKESIAEKVVEKQGRSINDLPPSSIVLSIDGRTLGRAQFNNMSKVKRQVGVDIK